MAGREHEFIRFRPYCFLHGGNEMALASSDMFHSRFIWEGILFVDVHINEIPQLA